MTPAPLTGTAPDRLTIRRLSLLSAMAADEPVALWMYPASGAGGWAIHAPATDLLSWLAASLRAIQERSDLPSLSGTSPNGHRPRLLDVERDDEESLQLSIHPPGKRGWSLFVRPVDFSTWLSDTLRVVNWGIDLDVAGGVAYLTAVDIERCRNVQRIKIDLSPTKETQAFQHLILTGPNGSGKSGILQGIVERLQRLLQGRTMEIVRPASGGAVVATSAAPGSGPDGDHMSLKFGAAVNLAAAFVRGEFICVFLPARRRLSSPRSAGPRGLLHLPRALGPTQQVAEDLRQFLVNKQAERAFALEENNIEKAKRIADWLDRFAAHLRWLTEDPGLKVEYISGAFDIRFRRSDGYVFDLATLADGHAAILAILAELLVRVDAARAARGDSDFEPAGIVVVDEIETHLHLSLQEKVLPFLAGLFPRIQFLVATHSPAIIASLDDAVVYDLKQRSQTPSLAFRGVPYGEVMTDHFGISSDIDLDSTEMLKELHRLAALPQRTGVEEAQFKELATKLSSRSQSLATEVWMARKQMASNSVRLVGTVP